MPPHRDEDTNPERVLSKLIRLAVSNDPRLSIYQDPNEKRIIHDFIDLVLELQETMKGPHPPLGAYSYLKNIDENILTLYKHIRRSIPEDVLQSIGSDASQRMSARMAELHKSAACKRIEDLLSAINCLSVKQRDQNKLIKKLKEDLEKTRISVLIKRKKETEDKKMGKREFVLQLAPSINVASSHHSEDDEEGEGEMECVFEKIVAEVSAKFPEIPDNARRCREIGIEYFLNRLRWAQTDDDDTTSDIKSPSAESSRTKAHKSQVSNDDHLMSKAYLDETIREGEKALAKSRGMSLEESREESRKVLAMMFGGDLDLEKGSIDGE